MTIRHAEHEMYFHAAYARTMGRNAAEGYHLLARVVPSGGRTQVVQGEGVNLADADGIAHGVSPRLLETVHAVGR